MNISEYYSRLFDLMYEFYGDVDGIEIVMEPESLNGIQGLGKNIRFRFTPIGCDDKHQEYFTFIISNQMSELYMIEQTVIEVTNTIINLPNPLDFIQFLLANTSLFQLNVKTASVGSR